MNLYQPHSFNRRILLVVSGMSPQILTETLFALIQQRASPFIPTEIHLITTLGGERNAQRYLLHADEGHFLQFCQEYQLNPAVFSSQSIRVIRNANGQPLEDIRTPQENEAAADFITDFVRSLTEDDCAALHVSMAGGRKTMGYYAGYALSLFGRQQDRLSHVLVSEPFEGLRSFYFPTRESHLIDTPSGKVLDAKDAEVTLAEIPFVRLRADIPEKLLAGNAGFSETISLTQRIDEPPHLVVNISAKRIIANGQEVSLPPLLFAFYTWIIRRQLDGSPDLCVRDMQDPNLEFAEEFLALFERIEGEMGRDMDRTREALAKGIEKPFFEEKKSLVKKALVAELGRTLGERYQISTSGKRGHTHYGVMLDAEQIDWID